MKHYKAVEVLGEWLVELGIVVGHDAADVAVSHLEWVLSENERLNLTSITDFGEGLRLHVLDSLLALPAVQSAPSGTLVDLGSGAGFPGVPLVAGAQRDAILIDSVTKKMRALDAFLETVIMPGGASVTTFAGRSEEYALRNSPAAVVTARAVAELPVLLELAAPLVQHGGLFVALKARPTDEELHRARLVADVVGFEGPRVSEFTLPLQAEARTVLVYRKSGESTVRLPRRPGMAKKRPLA